MTILKATIENDAPAIGKFKLGENIDNLDTAAKSDGILCGLEGSVLIDLSASNIIYRVGLESTICIDDDEKDDFLKAIDKAYGVKLEFSPYDEEEAKLDEDSRPEGADTIVFTCVNKTGMYAVSFRKVEGDKWEVLLDIMNPSLNK